MPRNNRKTAMVTSVIVAVAAITISNLLPGSSGSASGSDSSLGSKIAFTVGALSALVFVALVLLAVWGHFAHRRSAADVEA